MFSGVGGGAFASSMANISPFYQKKHQGYALGMNGGLGNLGVSLCQLILPLLFVHGDAASMIGGTMISNGGWPVAEAHTAPSCPQPPVPRAR